MPDRGLLAPLGPREEGTQPRVGLGLSMRGDLSAQDVERLKSLLLIEEFSAGVRLTPTGKERYLALPNSSAFESGAPDEGLAKMVEFISKARG
jgi:hypothetical protein